MSSLTVCVPQKKMRLVGSRQSCFTGQGPFQTLQGVERRNLLISAAGTPRALGQSIINWRCGSSTKVQLLKRRVQVEGVKGQFGQLSLLFNQGSILDNISGNPDGLPR